MNIPIDLLPAMTSTGVVEVEVAGRWCTVHTLQASVWLTSVQRRGATLRSYIPALLVPEDRAWIVDQLMAGRFTVGELDDAARSLISVATGFEWWWVAHRLLGSAAAGWSQLGGWLFANGFDPDRANIAQLLMLIYGRVIEHAHSLGDQDKAMQLFQALCMPPTDLPDFGHQMEIVGSIVLGNIINA